MYLIFPVQNTNQPPFFFFFLFSFLPPLPPTDLTLATCVFDSDFGFILNCNFKKSSLFRVRNLGGVKAHIGLGKLFVDMFILINNYKLKIDGTLIEIHETHPDVCAVEMVILIIFSDASLCIDMVKTTFAIPQMTIKHSQTTHKIRGNICCVPF